jgi:hypothetical protein
VEGVQLRDKFVAQEEWNAWLAAHVLYPDLIVPVVAKPKVEFDKVLDDLLLGWIVEAKHLL